MYKLLLWDIHFLFSFISVSPDLLL